MKETEGLLALNAVHGIGPQTIGKILQAFKSAAMVFEAKRPQLMEAGILTARQVEAIACFPVEDFLAHELKIMEKEGIRVLSLLDDEYPLLLKEIPDAPYVLYIKGSYFPPNELALAIVGSRRASLYGYSTAEKLAAELAALGFTIISGLARGVDTAAHHGALQAQGNTVAVLGCGLAQIYPPENRNLYDAIIKQGAVISEFCLQTLPKPHNFPRRNRIISGLSLGTVITEAFQRSGALITARLALEQGREVFAIPGNIENPLARGTNQLIKEGAVLVESVEDIITNLKNPLERYLLSQDKTSRSQGGLPADTSVSEEERSILSLIGHHPLHLDELVLQTGKNCPDMLSIIVKLKLKKMINELPGHHYVVTSGHP